MSSDTKSRGFFGGIPTDPDVKKLRRAFPDEELSTDQIITYEQVSAILGVKKGSSRFKTVTTAWRNRVFEEKDIMIVAVKNRGFRKANETEKVNASSSQLRKAGRSTKRSFVITGKVDVSSLSDKDKQRLEHNQTISSKVLAIQSIRQIKGGTS